MPDFVIQDEILDIAVPSDAEAIPRFDLIDPAGNVTAENVMLQLKNPVMQEGTQIDTALVNAIIGTVLEPLKLHVDDTEIHVSEADRERWNAGGDGSGGGELLSPVKYSIGTYVGTGTAAKDISLDFQPNFALIFRPDYIPTVFSLSGEYSRTWLTFSVKLPGLTSVLSMTGMEIISNGIRAKHAASVPSNGMHYQFNASGATFVYVALAMETLSTGGGASSGGNDYTLGAVLDMGYKYLGAEVYRQTFSMNSAVLDTDKPDLTYILGTIENFGQYVKSEFSITYDGAGSTIAASSPFLDIYVEDSGAICVSPQFWNEGRTPKGTVTIYYTTVQEDD
ncbi:MAG: hypothetical protein LBB94_05370 [Clostridiales bacterium]|jgi:hypothetical protein|nr:hypothetical protein [Clostridiales bacterium]